MLWKEIAIVGVAKYCSGCDSILLYYIILLWVEFKTTVGGSWLNTVVGVKQL